MNKPFAFLALLAASTLAAADTYEIDGNHTFPHFSWNHLGFSTQSARFDRTTGTIAYDALARKGAVEIVIDTRSVSTGSPTFNEHIQGEDFFDTARHPTASFKSTKVVFDGEKPVRIEGELTLKGVTKPVTLTVTSFTAKPHPMLRKEALGANAWAVVRRSEFGLGKYAPAVGDEVKIEIAIEAVRR